MAPVQEPWDELMGPSPDELKQMMSSSHHSNNEPPVRRGMSAVAPPPRTFNHSTAEDIMYDNEAIPLRKVQSLPAGHSLDEDDAANPSSFDDPTVIRQEALRMLQVADDADSGPYAVYKTATGGYQATHKTMGHGASGVGVNKKRVPSALAGLDFTARRMPSKPEPPASHFSSAHRLQEDAEYGDVSNVDVVAMEDRFKASRPSNDSSTKANSSWSSRYSVDNTLLALSGGTVSNSRILDELDKDYESRERTAARNLFAASGTKIFGNGGFDFRQKNVFGQQSKVNTYKDTANLKTVWANSDNDNHDLPPASPAKSWQEQVRIKKRQQRRYLAILAAVFIAVVTTTLMVARKRTREINAASASIVQNTLPKGAVTFQVTSNTPYSDSSATALMTNLGNLEAPTSFFMHLGNMQDSIASKCVAGVYEDTATILKTSPVPVMIVPGSQDYTDCPDPELAFEYWTTYLGYFEKSFARDFAVRRQYERQENFAFIIDEVLFLGVHLTAGKVNDWDEQRRKMADNAAWVTGMATDSMDTTRATVIFANSPPGLPQHQDFFNTLLKDLEYHPKPTVYVHANPGGTKAHKYSPLKSDSFQAIQVIDGSRGDPLRITVGFGDDPFIIG